MQETCSKNLLLEKPGAGSVFEGAGRWWVLGAGWEQSEEIHCQP